MSLQIGYLLPTRERVMGGHPETRPLLELGQQAEALGYDSVWVGDSLLAKPRHEPLTLLAGVAGCTERVALGTAVLLPALRNPVVLAHQVATLDRVSEGRVILGVGIAADLPSVRAEFAAAGVPFEQRVGRMMEGLRLARALWTGEPVDWAGRWRLEGAVLGPTPHRPGGPPIWNGSLVPAGLARTARELDGWFPTGPDPAGYAEHWAHLQALARDAGRDPDALAPALYLTLALDETPGRADAQIDRFLEAYYGQPPAVLRERQACFGGSASGAAEWLTGYVEAGVRHLVLRFAGDHARHLEAFARVREQLPAPAG